MLLFVNRYTRPVSDMLTASGRALYMVVLPEFGLPVIAILILMLPPLLYFSYFH